jgi:hypothetical protein
MTRRSTPSVLAVAVALAAATAEADDTGKDPARNEISVFGGISILDARSSQQTTVTLPAIPGLPALPGFPGYPGSGPRDVQVGTETKLGNGAILGLRYAFYLRKQLALEVDGTVAPSQDLRSSVTLCGTAATCVGRGDYDRVGTVQAYDAAMNSFFAGPMGGRFPGMDGMHAGEGRFHGHFGYGGRSVTAWHYGAGVNYDIRGGDVRPFVTVGAGGVSYEGAPGAKTDFVLRFGGGVKVYFGRLGARVDAVDHLVFDNFLSGHDEHDVHITGGAFVRF